MDRGGLVINIYDIWFSRVEITNSIKLRLLQKFESSEIWNLSRNDLIELKLKEVTRDTLNEFCSNNF